MQSLIVEIPGFGKHPNADSLSITNIMGGACIFRTGLFKKGDKAIYIQIDSLLPNNWKENPRLSFIKEQRIRAIKLRGVFSMGLLISVLDSEKGLPAGTCMDSVLGITRYEEKFYVNHREIERSPEVTPIYKVSNYRHHKDVLIPGEEVVVTEKIHGKTSQYFCYKDKNYAGSHYAFWKPNEMNLWWRIFDQYSLDRFVKEYENKYALYGEVYGDKVQDLTYGLNHNGIGWRLFDIFDIEKQGFIDYDLFKRLSDFFGLPTTPVLYKGPYGADLIEPMRNGKSVLANQMREGVVIRPVKERFDNSVKHGRVILKLVGEDYLLRKNGTEFH